MRWDVNIKMDLNSDQWDLRTFHLLHTVPALDQCQIRFNHNGDIIYGGRSSVR